MHDTVHIDTPDRKVPSPRRLPIVVAVTAESGEIETVVAPITPAQGVEIPRRVRDFLGLDSQRSWAIVTDLNSFLWPGIDVHPVPNSPPGTYEYGHLPPRLFDVIRDRIAALRSVEIATKRTE